MKATQCPQLKKRWQMKVEVILQYWKHQIDTMDTTMILKCNYFIIMYVITKSTILAKKRPISHNPNMNQCSLKKKTLVLQKLTI